MLPEEWTHPWAKEKVGEEEITRTIANLSRHEMDDCHQAWVILTLTEHEQRNEQKDYRWTAVGQVERYAPTSEEQYAGLLCHHKLGL